MVLDLNLKAFVWTLWSEKGDSGQGSAGEGKDTWAYQLLLQPPHQASTAKPAHSLGPGWHTSPRPPGLAVGAGGQQLPPPSCFWRSLLTQGHEGPAGAGQKALSMVSDLSPPSPASCPCCPPWVCKVPQQGKGCRVRLASGGPQQH